MLTEIAWLMTNAYIILIFTAAVIRSEQILYMGPEWWEAIHG